MTGSLKIDKPFLDRFFKRELLKKNGLVMKQNGVCAYKSCWKAHLTPLLGSRPFDDLDTFLMRFYTSTKGGNHGRETEERYNALKALYRNLTPEEKADLVPDPETLEYLMAQILPGVMAQAVLREQTSGSANKNMRRIGPVDWDKLTEDVKLHTVKVLGQLDPGIDELMNAIIVNLYVTCNAPRRCEYANLCLIDGSDHEGQLDNTYNDGIILLRNYKTAIAYGEYTFRVNRETKALFDLLLPKLGGSKYIFYPFKDTDEAQRLYRWTKRVENAFRIVSKKGLHATDLRKIYFSNKIRGRTMYNEDIWQIATEMGTSREKLMSCYAVPPIIE